MKLIIYLIIGFFILNNAIINVHSETAKQITEYYKFSISFSSPGDGINRKKWNELENLLEKWNKKYNNKIKYETIFFGREGARSVNVDVSELQIPDRQNLFVLCSKKFRNNKFNTGIQSNLVYNPNTQIIHLSLSLINNDYPNESEVLNLVSQLEKEYNLKINNGKIKTVSNSLENEDQKYEFNLSGLNQQTSRDILNKILEIYQRK